MTIQPLQSRTERYLISALQTVPAGLEPVDLDILASEIFPNIGIELLDKIPSVPGQRESEQTEFLVASMTFEKFELLSEQYKDRLIVEEDTTLDIFQSESTELPIEQYFDLNLIPLDGQELSVQLVVKGGNPAQPIKNAKVYLIGSIWFANGTTDKEGKITLTLYGETVDTLRSLYIKPANSYWSYWIAKPDVKQGEENLISLQSLSDQFPQFPQQEMYGWGQQAMNLDPAKIPYKGTGVKIGIIDSGLYTEHKDLGDGKDGSDFTKDANETSWRKDIVGHGSHVAGIIAGLHESTGIKGFAPDSDIYVYKVFPGGRFSDLIKGLNKCIENQVDVVNLSLGSKKRSEILAQKITDATNKGVACIAAAGNSATKIQYPAAFDEVLAVAAIGQFGTFPENSYHKRQVGEYKSNNGKYFTARFTCFAEEGQTMDVCAPGVAIISSIPDKPDAYAAWDGTSMACPQVVGLAALIIEAHKDIRDMPRNRQRVEALFTAIRDSAVDIGLPSQYQGKGLPDTQKALNISSIPSNKWQKIEELLTEALQLLSLR